MAFRRMRGRRRGKSWISKQEHLWTVAVSNQTIVAPTGSIIYTVVAQSDWAVRLGTSYATFIRLRGYISFTSVTVAPTNAAGCVQAAAFVRNVSDSVVTPDLSNVVSYLDEDVLWTDGRPLVTFTAGGVATGIGGGHFDVDIKTRRRLHNDEELLVICRCTGTPNDVEFTGVLRGLIAMK